MRRIAVALAFVLSAAVFAVGGAGSATSKSAFAVFVEETTSAASNGLTLNSTLDVAAKTASGDGVHEVFAG
jgi:archaellin